MIAGFDAEVRGETGTPLLLLPGGASTSRDFFPYLQEMPGHRVVLMDRPGTGRAASAGPATLSNGAAAAAAVLRESGCSPAIVVGQSLGGAVAVQLAVDYPDVVRGLVLIDPTPFNEAGTCTMARWLFELFALPSRLPVVGDRIDRLTWKALARGERFDDDEKCRRALAAMIESATLKTTARATYSLVREGAVLTPRLRDLGRPSVLLTADRKPGHRVTRAHEQIARALGARVETWPGAVHAEHLRRPKDIVRLVEQVEAESEASS